MPDPAFKRLGKYEIQAELGRGGFGTVFRAFDPTVGRLVALKVLVSDAGKDLVTRFRTEATAAGNLRHENIVTIYEFGDDKGLAFIAMEYLEGEDLQKVLVSGKPLTLLEKISIMTQAAAGLDCAHRHGVVHRDVKPANIRLLPDGRVKIMDFGIARLIRDAGVARLTRRGHLLGTLLYMAPEQLMGSDTDALSDIFAYGVTFYELLTGRHPFQADDPRSVFYKITSEDPELIHDLIPDCPETLDHVVRRALHKDRELRYQTLRDLRVDIEPVLTALRRERAAELVNDAQRLVADRSLDPALALLNEAIDFDSANQTARQLRDSVQNELRRRLVRPRIEALLAKADRCLEDGNHNDAVQALEAALQLDSRDSALQSRLRDVQQRRDQARESRRLLAEARSDFVQGSLALALHKASEAMALNPKSADAQSLLEMVREELNKRERQQRLNEKLHQARELLLLGSLDDAYGVIDTVEPDDRDAPETRELMARLEAQKADLERRERLNNELAAAGELLDGGQFVHAVQGLQRLRSEFPDEPRIARLLSQAQQKAAAFERTQAIERIQTKVLACAEARQFDDAVAILTSAAAEYPDDTGLLRLRETVNLAKSAWERQQTIDQTVRLCDALADDDRFDDALAALVETRREYPDDAALERLERRLEAEREKFRRAQAVLRVLDNANRLIEQRQPERAVADLEAALTDLPDERLRSALADAQQALSVKERAAEIDRLEREVAPHLEQQEFDRALRLLDRASNTLAGEPALARLRDAVIGAQAAWEKGEAIAAAENAARSLAGERRFEEAIATICECLERFPETTRLVRLESSLRKDHERHERSEAIKAALEEAQALAATADLLGAVNVLREAAARFPGETAIGEALVRVEESVRRREREREIVNLINEARDLTAKGEFELALKMANRLSGSEVAQSEIEALRTEIATAQDAAKRRIAEQQRAEAIEAAIGDAEKLLSSDRSREALECLERLQSRYGPVNEIAVVRARAERGVTIELAVNDAATLTDAGRLDDAFALLERTRTENGASPELDDSLRRASEAVAKQARERALAEAVETVAAHLRSNEFDRAQAVIDAVELVPAADPRLDALRAEIASAREAWSSAQQIAAAVRECERLCAEEKYKAAFDAAESALKTHPGAAGLTAVQSIALAGLDRQKRRAEITECTVRAAELTRAGKPEEAMKLIAATRNRLGFDPTIEAALSDAEAAIEAQQRREVIRVAVERARDDAAANGFAEALAWLDSVEADWGADETIAATRQAIVAARARADQQREIAESEEQQRAEALRASVNQAAQQVTDLIDAGNLAEAGRALQKAMRSFSDQAELIAVQQRLKTESDRQRRTQATRRAADNARALLAQAQTTRAVELLEAAAAQYPGDPVILELLASARKVNPAAHPTEAVEAVCRETKIYLEQNDFDRALKTVTVNLETHSGEPRLVALRDTVLAARLHFERNAVRKRRPSVAEAVTDDPSLFLPPADPHTSAQPRAWLPPEQPSHPTDRGTVKPRSGASYTRKIALAGVFCACAVAAALVGVRMVRPGTAATALTIETEPAGAAVRIDGRSCATPDCGFNLPAGKYRVDASLPGYAATWQQVTIRKGERAHVRLALSPVPTSVVVTSNFAAGSVEVDGRSAGETKDGQLVLDVKPGKHQFRLTSPEGELSLSFKSSVAKPPELIGDIASRDLGAVVITGLGSHVQAACSRCDGKPMLDGKPLQGQAIGDGVHELTAHMASGETQRLSFRTQEAPTISVHLISTTSAAGTLVVQTNVDGASVAIDQRALGRQTEGGRLMIPLEPRSYRVEVRKPGYRVTPDHVMVKVHKGDQFRTEFRLEPISAAVAISAAIEGATVLIDGTRAGTVRGGRFSASVAPGVHTVSLAKEGFKTASIQRSFTAGESVRLDGSALSLEPLQQPAKAPAQPSAEEMEMREWIPVRSGRERAAIQAFLQKHPNGPHTQEAQLMLAQIEWDALDRTDRSALERFATRYRGTSIAEQANSEMIRMDREKATAADAAAAATAAKRAEEQAVADRKEIDRVLTAYASAFEKKDLNSLKTIWPGLPEASLAQAFRGKGAIRSQLRPVAPVELAGDRATVRCIRVTEQVTPFGRQKPVEEARTVRLYRENGRWIISAID
jgi:serine/threonine-protein kinase